MSIRINLTRKNDPVKSHYSLTFNITLKMSNSEKVEEEEDKFLNAWMIRPCWLYKDEYEECTCWKARFHQYFIHGRKIDCSTWKEDYKNCQAWEENNSEDAYNALVENETNRRRKRLRAHFANTVWKKRDKPPENWNEPLPEWMQEKFKNSYLDVLKDEKVRKQAETWEKYCTIM